jgi:cellobiose phosphorylase
MPGGPKDVVRTPRRDDLGLVHIANRTGLSVSVLPSGAVFALEHAEGDRRILINQVLGSPIAGAMGRIFVRRGGAAPMTFVALGPGSPTLRIGHDDDRFVWECDESSLVCRVTLSLPTNANTWLWRVELRNESQTEAPCDVVFVQDLGLGEQGFLMGNEAYASQYLDHFVAGRPRGNPVLMTRQNLDQRGAHPWTAHGCLEGAASFATDYRELMGPAWRDADRFGLAFGESLPSSRLQYETACTALQSRPAVLAAGAEAAWTFFGVFRPDHPRASSEADLAAIEEVERESRDWSPRSVALAAPARSLLERATPALVEDLDTQAIRIRYKRRSHIERAHGRTLSFFIPDRSHNRHVVLSAKERIVWRRHGAILVGGGEMAPTETTLSATCWMHGVFGAQLTIGNTSFHKLFSVSRDPYNINRGAGLRILVDLGAGWRLLAVPSAFEMGLSDCRWIYRLSDRTIAVSALVGSGEPAMQWRIAVEGEACRFLIFGHVVLGEREFDRAARIEIDARRKEFAFRPDPDDPLWGRRYPHAVYRWVTSTPDRVDAIGADELLYADGVRRSGAYAAIRTLPTKAFAFAVVGSLTDEAQAAALAARYAKPVDEEGLLARSDQAWRKVTRGLGVKNAKAGAKAIETIWPWLVHDAIVHLIAPHGLEQYTGAAWGTRDVCQGPLEMLLSLEHDEPANAILRTLFAQQYETAGGWPQWFMLEPYSAIQDREAHGDVIVWPLKALCDYIEATGDLAFLDEGVAWRRDKDFEKTDHQSAVAAHVALLIKTAAKRFVPGTHLLRYGNGDWNDSLQPVDAAKRDWMVSSWTVALFYQQLRRYAEILRRAARPDAAKEHDALAAAMSAEVHRFLVRDGVLAGYGVFDPGGGPPRLLLHPSDVQTGPTYSLISMTQAIIGGLFTADEARDHLALIRKRLLFPDGARLMDAPLAYHGGVETVFRRAESSAFFGREIGLMYTHAHLRYGEAASDFGRRQALWDALMIANPIAVTDRLKHASLRQRNAYFSSSDAAFRDRYHASADWKRVRTSAIAVDGGWRIYSSGPGIYAYLIIQHVFGIRRRFGKRIVKPRLPPSQQELSLDWDILPFPRRR